jgi:hypothetical protein
MIREEANYYQPSYKAPTPVPVVSRVKNVAPPFHL